MNRRVDFCECWPAECIHQPIVPEGADELEVTC